MKLRVKLYVAFFLATIFLAMQFSSYAQIDTSNNKKTETFIGKMIDNFKKDTTEQPIDELKTNEQKYLKYDGNIIREVIIHKLPFGIPFSDTTKKLVNALTQLANTLHHTTRSQVIKNNLFFFFN